MFWWFLRRSLGSEALTGRSGPTPGWGRGEWIYSWVAVGTWALNGFSMGGAITVRGGSFLHLPPAGHRTGSWFLLGITEMASATPGPPPPQPPCFGEKTFEASVRRVLISKHFIHLMLSQQKDSSHENVRLPPNIRQQEEKVLETRTQPEFVWFSVIAQEHLSSVCSSDGRCQTLTWAKPPSMRRFRSKKQQQNPICSFGSNQTRSMEKLQQNPVLVNFRLKQHKKS